MTNASPSALSHPATAAEADAAMPGFALVNSRLSALALAAARAVDRHHAERRLEGAARAALPAPLL